MKYFEYRGQKREAKLAHQIEMDTIKEEDFRREKESLSEAHIALRKREVLELIAASTRRAECDHKFSHDIITEYPGAGCSPSRYLILYCDKCGLVEKERI